MTTQVKLAPNLPKWGVPDLQADAMWGDLGGTYIAIVEVEVIERTEPADDEEKDRSLKLRVTGIELAQDADQEAELRGRRRAMYLQRTKEGTLDEAAT